LSVRSEVEERQQIEVEEESLLEAVRRATTLSAVCSARRKWCPPPSPARDFYGAHDIAQVSASVVWHSWPAGGVVVRGLAAVDCAHRARTWLERRQRQPMRENVELDRVAAVRIRQSARREERTPAPVMTALEKLSVGSHERPMLHYMEDLPTPQIAVHLRIPEEAGASDCGAPVNSCRRKWKSW